MMPPQLARSDRRRKSQPRGIVEPTPNINIGDLCRWNAFPQTWDKSYFLEALFKYPFAKSLVISRHSVEINYVSGYTQTIALHWARTGFGRPRPFFVCGQWRLQTVLQMRPPGLPTLPQAGLRLAKARSVRPSTPHRRKAHTPQ
jgi:hypothetical protein